MTGYVYRGDEPFEPKAPPKPRTGRRRVEGVFNPAKCGTRAGYSQHRRYDQDPCLQCRVANAAYIREYGARKRVR
jgi:hypothetical protein